MSATTVAEAPPERDRKSRFSVWAAAFEEARAHPGQWRRVLPERKRSTVQQIASDVRNAHKRGKTRMKGILPGERWAAEWGEKPSGSGDFYVWIRLDEST